MRFFLWAILLFSITTINGQFQFKGQVAEQFKGKTVYLSLVDDYRKTSRVYLDQIIQKTKTDSLGFFSFTGDNIPNLHRIYRIHVDGCNDTVAYGNHFLRECNLTESILFIAKNKDSIVLPKDFGQAFCEITSTNPISKSLLEVESLKEEMILDFIEHETEAARSLNFEKWFKKFHDFGIESSEPLVELYIHGFLSNRTNETHSHFSKTVNDTYYNGLLNRLETIYPDETFTEQYRNELAVNTNSINKEVMRWYGFKFSPTLWVIIALLVLVILFGYRFFNKKRKQSTIVFTPQEQKIINGILAKKSNKEIASELFISLSTVKTHVNNIYKKAGVSSRIELQKRLG